MACAWPFAATDRRAVNAWIAHQAEVRNIPINVVDDRELSRFIMPAIIDRSPVIVAGEQRRRCAGARTSPARKAGSIFADASGCVRNGRAS